VNNVLPAIPTHAHASRQQAAPRAGDFGSGSGGGQAQAAPRAAVAATRHGPPVTHRGVGVGPGAFRRAGLGLAACRGRGPARRRPAAAASKI
jgi:hypothetical protein